MPAVWIIKGEQVPFVFFKASCTLSVARKVMEETPHVMLAGEGAKQFALNGV